MTAQPAMSRHRQLSPSYQEASSQPDESASVLRHLHPDSTHPLTTDTRRQMESPFFLCTAQLFAPTRRRTSMSQHRCGCPRHLDDLLWPWPFTFDLQNLIRSSVGTDEYSLSLLQKLFKVFLRYCGNNICPDEWTNKQTNRRTNATTRQSKNLMPSLTVSVGVRSFVHYCGQRSSLLWTLALIPYALAHGENGNG